jgi:hypothetical protein
MIATEMRRPVRILRQHTSSALTSFEGAGFHELYAIDAREPLAWT